MIGKRLAETQLTPEELERENKQQQQQDNQQATSEELAGRKILKVKRYIPGDKIVEEPGKGVFRLSGSISVSPAQQKTLEPQKPASIVFKVAET